MRFCKCLLFHSHSYKTSIRSLMEKSDFKINENTIQKKKKKTTTDIEIECNAHNAYFSIYLFHQWTKSCESIVWNISSWCIMYLFTQTLTNIIVVDFHESFSSDRSRNSMGNRILNFCLLFELKVFEAFKRISCITNSRSMTHFTIEFSLFVIYF